MSAVSKRVMTFTIGLMMLGAVSAGAVPRRGAVVVIPHGIHRAYPYDPFWGSWDPYAYAYPYVARSSANLRTDVTPKDTEVCVDGFDAGEAGKFDGMFQRLQVRPGGHSVTLHLEGFRTMTQEVYVSPDSTFTIHTTMERLAAGEATAPVPAPAR